MPWVVIGISLFGADSGDGGPPGSVYGILGSIFLLFNFFAINMVLQYKKPDPGTIIFLVSEFTFC